MKVFILIGLLVALAVGCSKKKEEAARLEEEMRAQQATADTAADSMAMLADTTGMGEMDVGAIPEEEEREIVPQYEEEQGYVVQVAACESLDYAQFLVERYSARGYEPYMTTTTVDGQTYYRVRIGGLGSSQEAKELKDELLDKYSVTAWVDKTE